MAEPPRDIHADPRGAAGAEPPHPIAADPRGAAAKGAVVVRPRWWAVPAAAAGCLVFVVSGVVLIVLGGAYNVAIGLMGVVFFGGGLVALLSRRPWRWSILIDGNGVTWRRPGGDTLVRWANIAAVRVTRLRTGRVGRQTFVTLTLHDPSAVDQPALGPLNGPLLALNRRLVGGEASIGWSERDRPADELAALLNRHLDAWRSAA